MQLRAEVLIDSQLHSYYGNETTHLENMAVLAYCASCDSISLPFPGTTYWALSRHRYVFDVWYMACKWFIGQVA